MHKHFRSMWLMIALIGVLLPTALHAKVEKQTSTANKTSNTSPATPAKTKSIDSLLTRKDVTLSTGAMSIVRQLDQEYTRLDRKERKLTERHEKLVARYSRTLELAEKRGNEILVKQMQIKIQKENDKYERKSKLIIQERGEKAKRADIAIATVIAAEAAAETKERTSSKKKKKKKKKDCDHDDDDDDDDDDEEDDDDEDCDDDDDDDDDDDEEDEDDDD